MMTLNPQQPDIEFDFEPSPGGDAADDIADAVRSATGCDLSVTLVSNRRSGTMELAGFSSDEWFPDAEESIERLDGDTPAARAAHRRTTLIFGHGGNPVDGLPEWTHESGFEAAIVVPIIRGDEALGAVYALFTSAHVSTLSEINQAELAVSMGARSLPTQADPLPGDPVDVFSAQGVEPGMVRDLAPLRFEQATLDPVREQVVIGEVNVALSRTEFMMLYVMGQTPGAVVPHHVLLETCWQDDFPALTAVDATVYRLRKKLANAHNGRNLVRTVRGEGYMLNPSLQGKRARKTVAARG